VYLYRSDNDDQPVAVTGAYKLALTVLAIGIVLIGTMFGPWYNWAATAAAGMF
jgi:hypothetical protein